MSSTFKVAICKIQMVTEAVTAGNSGKKCTYRISIILILVFYQKYGTSLIARVMRQSVEDVQLKCDANVAVLLSSPVF
jgi:hypothetical protein